MKMLQMRLVGFSADNRILISTNVDSLCEAFDVIGMTNLPRYVVSDMAGFVCQINPFCEGM